MTKTYKFTSTNNNNSINKKFFLNSYKPKSYSEILDDLIIADVANKNSYLFTTTPSYTAALKDSDSFTKAAKFLANYKTYKKTYKLPFILGKMYELTDGTPIIFYDDEIQIGFDTYSYSDFSNISFLNTLSAPKKKIIINIFTDGLDNIKINLL